MKNYLVIYHAPMDAMESTNESTPEEMEAAMKPWMEWAAKCGDQLTDMGNPLGGGIALHGDGSSQASSSIKT